MRILHVTDAYLPRLGGIEMHVRDLAQAQVAAGDDVDILTLTRGQRPPDPAGPIDVLRPLPADGIPSKLRFMLEHRDHGSTGKYDVVHAHCSTISPMSFLAVGAPGSARVLTLHSLWRRYIPIYRAADSLLNWSDWPVAWSAVSRAAAEDLRRAARRDIDVAVLPNGIDVDSWSSPDQPRPDRVEAPACFRILAVMRLATRKRPLALLRIVRAVRAAVPDHIDVRVVVAGEGPARPAMERYLARHRMSDWVSLPGHVSRVEIRRMMAASDVFVAPATLESFGIAALEAHAAGLPVIGRTGTGLADFIRDGESGVLVDSDRQMVEVLAGLATSDAHKDLSTSAELEGFRWAATLERHRALYEAADALRSGGRELRVP